MAKKKFQILLASTVLAFILSGCGNSGFNPPSDEEMLRNFLAYEDEFNEIVEILRNCPYGDIYPPFYPIERTKDSLCLASLGPEKRARLDTLLNVVGCERVRFTSRHSRWQFEHCNYDSIPPVEALRDSVTSSFSFMYYCDGWSIGPSVDKTYEYKPDNQPADTCDGDLNKLIEIAAANSEIPGITADKHIKGNWYIELFYDK